MQPKFTRRSSWGMMIARPALAAGLALVPAVPSALAQQFTMKFATQTLNDVHTEYMRAYKEELEKATGGRIKVEIYPAAQLGAAPRQVEGLRLGTIQAAIGPAELFVGADPRLQAVALPGVFKGHEHAWRAAQVPAFRKTISEVVETRQLLLLGITPYAAQGFVFKAPVAQLKDFAGKRIRILASEGERTVTNAIGGAGVPMPLPEVLSALQQGTIDGVNSGLPVFVAFKYADTAPYLVDTRLWQIVSIAMASQRWFDGLPPDLKKAVIDTGSKIEPEVAKWSAARAAKDSATWAAAGGKVVALPAAEQADAGKKAEAAIQPLLQGNAPLKEFYEKIKAAAASVQ